MRTREASPKFTDKFTAEFHDELTAAITAEFTDTPIAQI